MTESLPVVQTNCLVFDVHFWIIEEVRRPIWCRSLPCSSFLCVPRALHASLQRVEMQELHFTWSRLLCHLVVHFGHPGQYNVWSFPWIESLLQFNFFFCPYQDFVNSCVEFFDMDTSVDVCPSLGLLSHCRVHLGTARQTIPQNHLLSTVHLGALRRTGQLDTGTPVHAPY